MFRDGLLDPSFQHLVGAEAFERHSGPLAAPANRAYGSAAGKKLRKSGWYLVGKEGVDPYVVPTHSRYRGDPST